MSLAANYLRHSVVDYAIYLLHKLMSIFDQSRLSATHYDCECSHRLSNWLRSIEVWDREPNNLDCWHHWKLQEKKNIVKRKGSQKNMVWWKVLSSYFQTKRRKFRLKPKRKEERNRKENPDFTLEGKKENQIQTQIKGKEGNLYGEWCLVFCYILKHSMTIELYMANIGKLIYVASLLLLIYKNYWLYKT